MSQEYKMIEPFMERIMSLKTALTLFEWDNETLAPKGASEHTTKIIGCLSDELHKALIDPELRDRLKACKGKELTKSQSCIIRELEKEIAWMEKVPQKEFREYAQLTTRSASIWAKAKKENDFESFAPVLKEIIEYTKKFAAYRRNDETSLYDVMLSEYEEEFDTKSLDLFFDRLKEELLPFLKQIIHSTKQIEDGFLRGSFSNESQEFVSYYLAKYLGFDREVGVIATSAHPFTTNLHNHDVRITTHYTDRLEDSIFSMIHEIGHGLYEMGIDDELTLTFAGQGASMAMHESQSRFLENYIGRSPSFWKPIYHVLQENFETLRYVDFEAFMEGINKVQPGLIRIQADELTYCFHILIRYEIEKLLVEEDLEVENLPKVWADKYEEYFGIRPKEDKMGVLQDIHWSQGSFGYFPSYALGTAFAAQFFEQMKKDLDVDTLLEEGQFLKIKEYLKEKIHRYGKAKTSRELLKDVTGEDFSLDYYVNYLKDKFSKIYDL